MTEDLANTGNYGKHTYKPRPDPGTGNISKSAGSAQPSRKCPARLWPFKRHKPTTGWSIEWEYERAPSFKAGTICKYCGEKI